MAGLEVFFFFFRFVLEGLTCIVFGRVCKRCSFVLETNEDHSICSNKVRESRVSFCLYMFLVSF